jgi:hypothetical protein
LKQHPSPKELLPKHSRVLKAPNQLPITIHGASGGPAFGSELERQYFSVFQSRTAAELCGFFESDIWSRLILQVCHREDYARHAVIAIGALHKTLEGTQHVAQNSSGAGSVNQHYTSALKYYGKALRLMQKISRENEDAFFQNTLISSLLTTCFEIFIGNQEDAILQAQTGIDVLFAWQEKRHKQMQPGQAWTSLTPTSFFNDDMFGTFARLDVMVMLFKDMHSIRQPLLKGAIVEYPFVPPEFSSVKEARLLWDIFIQRAAHWRYSFAEDGLSTLNFGENNMLGGEEAQKFLAESILYITYADEWHAAFLPLFNYARNQPGTKDFLGASALMLKYLSTRIAIENSSVSSETSSDALHAYYIQSVGLARDLLESHSRTQSLGKATFVFEENIICALFQVATKCRECLVRREAISLLRKYPRREGLWDSLMVATIATWIMNIEEESMVDRYVPQAARLMIVDNNFVLSRRKVMIRCSKLVEGSGERVMLPEVTLTW